MIPIEGSFSRDYNNRTTQVRAVKWKTIIIGQEQKSHDIV